MTQRSDATARVDAGDPVAPGDAVPAPALRLLSYNIQAGMGSARYRDYFVHSWRYLVPHARRWAHLDGIAERLRAYDVVALQETDAGSLRTGFVNPTEYLATRAGFPFWYDQVNRRIGRVAQHGNGLLARHRPAEVLDIKLPGPPGRGALVARFGAGDAALALIVLHLSLGRRTRARQLGFVAGLVNDYPHAVVMGDLNCDRDSPELHELCAATALVPARAAGGTFPSWRPRRCIDHILATADVRIDVGFVPNWLHSDHLPVAAHVHLPPGVSL